MYTHTRIRHTRLLHVVTPHNGYAKHGYATWLCHCGHVGYATYGYAKHGYATWSCHMWLRRLRHMWLRHMVTPHTGCSRGVKNYVKIWKNLFHLHFSKFNDMLTQQCFFSLRKLKCVFDLCTLNRVYLRSNRLVRPTIKFTTLWSAVSVLESNVH